jgi:hypothetical protein
LNTLHEQANCCNDGGNAQDVNLGSFTFFCCLLSLLASWSLPVDGEFSCLLFPTFCWNQMGH